MMLNIYEYALSLSNRAMNHIIPPWILINVVNVQIESNESH